MDRSVDLERYIDAQDGGVGEPYEEALSQMQRGRKTGCWIWYIFPQFIDPARASSKNNQRFQLFSKAEAVAFLKDETLGARYVEISQAVASALENDTPQRVMGGTVDAKKLHQSVTVFHLAALEAEMQDTADLLSNILEKIKACPYADGVERLDPLMMAKWEEF
eukprot:TRINITY_DN13977_c0_g1_i2.p1 TRINITY_DN13977_c0_g1~~TRINITY_DN13977_c0_g1_i2.p1  ORF type:complete len:164 (-),score=33.22 TRINITY_DN13977_c0_g1_i2:88-579(-)